MLKSMNSIVMIILMGFLNPLAARSAIEQVEDSDLVRLLTNEDKVVVLFSKNDCNECDKLEDVLGNIYDQIKSDIGAVVVKAHNSHMVNLYDPTKEPALVYFRRGTPLLYYGETDGETILQVFNENREPVVKELSDENFEHLTQASTGATTGDWFVFFYSADCVFCLRLYATWEAIGAHLRRNLNVARINRIGAGIATAKRFGVSESPEFLLLRRGKMFRYKYNTYTAAKLIEFAESEYRNQNPENIPPVESFLSSVSLNSRFVFFLFAVVLCASIIVFIKATPFKRAKVEKKIEAKKAK